MGIAGTFITWEEMRLDQLMILATFFFTIATTASMGYAKFNKYTLKTSPWEFLLDGDVFSAWLLCW
jgi:hypothetical protein